MPGGSSEEGPSWQVFEMPAHPYTRALAAAFPTIGDHTSRMSPAGLGGDPPTPGNLPQGCPFHPRCPLAHAACLPEEPDLRTAGRGAGGGMRAGVIPLVEVEDLHVDFGSARAVDGASLHVDPGEVLALVGESGSGKTTLIRAIQGLQKPTSGTIRLEGGQVDESTKKAIQTVFNPTVQMVFQDPTGALNPRQTIYEVVAEGLRIHGHPSDEEERVANALSRAGLRPPERFFPMYPHEVSGGQRQRVVIAGAMVMEPRLLLADEPVASLDASIRGEILALMRHLVDETGLSILVVTHDLGLAWNIADRVAVMYLGRIVETGPTEEILENPQHPYTRALLSVVPETEGDGTADPHRRDSGPDPDPDRVPVPPPMPVVQVGDIGTRHRRPLPNRRSRPGRGRGAGRGSVLGCFSPQERSDVGGSTGVAGEGGALRSAFSGPRTAEVPTETPTPRREDR